jgi:hypothetical protein
MTAWESLFNEWQETGWTYYGTIEEKIEAAGMLEGHMEQD